VDQQTNDPNTEARTALARRTASREPANGIRDLIERQKPEIARALHGTALDPERFARVALTVIRQSPQLIKCRPESLLGALMTCAQLGLEPGPLGEAYIVPYKDNVTFIPGYRGLIKLAWQSGQLRHISAHVVYTNDTFDYALGLEPTLVHRPARGTRGDAIYVYAVAQLVNGGNEFVVLTVGEVEEIRRRSAASAKGPWVTDWAPMAKKTAIRQLIRWLPLSTTAHRAVVAEGTVRTDLDPAAVDALDGEVVDIEHDAPEERPPMPPRNAPAPPDTASQSTASPSGPDDPPQDAPSQSTD
jgi:recombination protein RecT